MSWLFAAECIPTHPSKKHNGIENIRATSIALGLRVNVLKKRSFPNAEQKWINRSKMNT